MGSHIGDSLLEGELVMDANLKEEDGDSSSCASASTTSNININSNSNSNLDNHIDINHINDCNAKTNNSNPNNNSSAKNKKLFPQKLWDLINDRKYNFCLRWSDDGQLVYLNRDDFEDSYLKTNENQFHTQKAISFVRQMNMYGFRKVDDCYYENDNFKRGCPQLLKNMIRKHPNKCPLPLPLTLPLPLQSPGDLSSFLFDSSPANHSLDSAKLMEPSRVAPALMANLQSAAPSLLSNQLEPSNQRQDTFNMNLNLNQLAQLDANNMSAFYSLLSYINNFYPADLLNSSQHNLSQQQNLDLDAARIIYQQLLQSQLDSSGQLYEELDAPSDIQLHQAHKEQASPISLLVKNNSNPIELKTSPRISTSQDKNKKVKPTCDIRSSMSYKRSVDSILDSNNNPTFKKFKASVINDAIVNKSAKNLVTEVAKSRGVKLDDIVMIEASRYAERFVETLINTAQVIARHSNDDSNAPLCLDQMDTKININDLTSSLRLLPSKLPKILE